MTFAEKLKQWMQAQTPKATAVSLAKQAGLERSVVQRLVSGDREPNIDHYKALAPVLSITVDELMSEAPAMSGGASAESAEETIGRYLHDFAKDLTDREKQWLEDYRHRLDKGSRVTEGDIRSLLRVIREVYPPSRS